MTGSKKRTYEKKPFESTGIGSDTSANIYMSMLMSKAWRQLTANQRDLYVHCKAQLYAEKNKPNDNQLCFTMNQSKWCGLYALYKKTNAKGFYKDIAALISYGFIECVECGANTRTKSVYRFSSMWQKYGTEAFMILPSSKTNAMLRKERNKKA